MLHEQPQPEPEPKPQPEPEPEPEPQPEPKSQPEQELVSEPVLEPDPEPDPEPELYPEPEEVPEPEPEPEQVPEPELELEPEPEPEQTLAPLPPPARVPEGLPPATPLSPQPPPSPAEPGFTPTMRLQPADASGVGLSSVSLGAEGGGGALAVTVMELLLRRDEKLRHEAEASRGTLRQEFEQQHGAMLEREERLRATSEAERAALQSEMEAKTERVQAEAAEAQRSLREELEGQTPRGAICPEALAALQARLARLHEAQHLTDDVRTHTRHHTRHRSGLGNRDDSLAGCVRRKPTRSRICARTISSSPRLWASPRPRRFTTSSRRRGCTSCSRCPRGSRRTPPLLVRRGASSSCHERAGNERRRVYQFAQPSAHSHMSVSPSVWLIASGSQ